MKGPLSFSPSVLSHAASWPRWWLWAVVGMTVSLSWTVPFIPWWVGLGSGLCAVLTLTILAFYARKQYEEKPLEGEEVLNGHDAKQVLEQVDADEANHMIQMAGAWMRPGYLPPVLDFEDGAAERSGSESAQFALDFSNRIYAVMGIRPAIYFNGV